MAKKILQFEDVDFDTLCMYGGADAVATLQITKKLWPSITAKPLYLAFSGSGPAQETRLPSIYEELLAVKAPAHEFIVDMEVEGIPYDIPGNKRMAGDMEKEIAALEQEVNSHLGISPGDMNYDSSDDLMDLLYGERFKMAAPIQTGSGDDSTSYDALEELLGMYPEHKPWLKPLARRRRLASMYRSFIGPYVDKFVKRDGRVHPSYNLFGTSSHRISSSDPNLLNLPAFRSSKPYDIRSLYLAPEGAYAFLTMDFSSCEVKILAAMCGDEGLVQACREGKDFHTYTACLIYHMDYDEVIAVLESTDEARAINPELAARYSYCKEKRQGAKSVTFGLLYGSSAKAIAGQLHTTEEEVQKIMAAYFEVFPNIQLFIENAHRMAIHNHMLVTPFGQRKQSMGTSRVFKRTAVYNASLRNAQNFLIQSTASTLGLLVFAKINEEMKKLGGAIMCTVYDSFEAYVPLDKVAEALRIGYYYMNEWPQEQWPWLTFPIGADAEIGFDWGKTLQTAHEGSSQEECMALLRKCNAKELDRRMAYQAA